ncbi:hypothetical protein [Athalassotoga saccharophila]|uniref:hypothetical protein n=1 Tax=Athalassotoga saccharophila TaxID=1441386 RepID=UPI00137B876F|nr:hypothetical protein [Athalassotoga saccharophila]BBJ27535.1 hypothetical protein ATHSA_0411 [Athalassotoga saccharophila]
MKFWIFMLVLVLLVPLAFAQNFFVGLETNSGFLGIGGGIDTPHAIIGGSLQSYFGETDIGLNFTNVLGNLYSTNNFNVKYGWTSLFYLTSGYVTNFGFGVGGSLIEHLKVQNMPFLFRQTVSLNTSLMSLGAFVIGTNFGFYYEF